jgi:hypothetical protein
MSHRSQCGVRQIGLSMTRKKQCNELLNVRGAEHANKQGWCLV